MTLKQTPSAEVTTICYRGDIIVFTLDLPENIEGTAWIRTNLGFADVRRQEIINYTELNAPILSCDWQNLKMQIEGKIATITLPLNQVGYFEAKCFFTNTKDEIIWSTGGNTKIKVEPAYSCAGNTMYTAFVRQFGQITRDSEQERIYLEAQKTLGEQGYTIIPPSGKFRDLIKQLDFIIYELRSNIIQLLPIHPTPTTYARMGTYGSPFAAIDFFDVDPIYAEFDKTATPLDQFIELIDAIHARNAQVFIDIPVNHTGWASKQQTLNPSLFVKNEHDEFVSPGAWGVVWADLCKLDYNNSQVHSLMADVFLFWCRNGIDGFRCDAGYMLPLHAWKYITARVREEFPDVIFMLEGLGGPIEVMESLLTEGNLNWAYSELFQNYSQHQLNWYLPNAYHTSIQKGTLINFAETHDNSRLAANSPTWSKMRTAISALTSHTGAFGFTNGVEWLAKEQINVHENCSINWDAKENIVQWIKTLQTIISTHKAFYPQATQELIHTSNSGAIAMLRENKDDKLLILCNLNESHNTTITWQKKCFEAQYAPIYDLISQKAVEINRNVFDESYELMPGEVLCLTQNKNDLENLQIALADNRLNDHNIREKQKLKSLVWDIWSYANEFNDVRNFDIESACKEFCNDPIKTICDLTNRILPPVTVWNFPSDEHREVMIPYKNFLLMKNANRFVATINVDKEKTYINQYSTYIEELDCHIALIPTKSLYKEIKKAKIKIAEFSNGRVGKYCGNLLLLPKVKIDQSPEVNLHATGREVKEKELHVVMSNKFGGMAKIQGAWGELRSKYDALLAANVNKEHPVDRQVMFAKCKAWCLYKGFSQEINIDCLNAFYAHPDNQAAWSFDVPCGQGKRISFDITATMDYQQDRIQLMFNRNEVSNESNNYLEPNEKVTIILRPFIEDRCIHSVTKAYHGAEEYFSRSLNCLENGFDFNPSNERKLQVQLSKGVFKQSEEWEYMAYYPEDNERVLDCNGDLYSPGYFDVELGENETVFMFAGVNIENSELTQIMNRDVIVDKIDMDNCLKEGLKRFLVKRDDVKTIIAGYPWFLDWGRDSLICLRGYISAGYLQEAKETILQFSRAEENGTLPNMIQGNNYSNRETSDAALWLAVCIEDYIEAAGSDEILHTTCDENGRTILQVIESISDNYCKGTPNGIKVDAESGLVFSPSHFTWMDTNYPASTPRQGYPIEIQVLWWKLNTFLSKYCKDGKYLKLSELALESIKMYYVNDRHDYLVDCLHADFGQSAKNAVADDACRCNQLFALTLGAIKDKEVQRKVIMAVERLIIPGSIRSLADMPVNYPLPIYHNDNLLNNPLRPYYGQSTGDEDTSHKPSYHNGTGWGWVFPSYAEAIYQCGGEDSQETAQAILHSIKLLLEKDCLGQLPENSDGNYPHHPRGCSAQAWSVSEALRVLNRFSLDKKY